MIQTYTAFVTTENGNVTRAIFSGSGSYRALAQKGLDTWLSEPNGRSHVPVAIALVYPSPGDTGGIGFACSYRVDVSKAVVEPERDRVVLMLDDVDNGDSDELHGKPTTTLVGLLLTFRNGDQRVLPAIPTRAEGAHTIAAILRAYPAFKVEQVAYASLVMDGAVLTAHKVSCASRVKVPAVVKPTYTVR